MRMYPYLSKTEQHAHATQNVLGHATSTTVTAVQKRRRRNTHQPALQENRRTEVYSLHGTIVSAPAGIAAATEDTGKPRSCAGVLETALRTAVVLRRRDRDRVAHGRYSQHTFDLERKRSGRTPKGGAFGNEVVREILARDYVLEVDLYEDREGWRCRHAGKES